MDIFPKKNFDPNPNPNDVNKEGPWDTCVLTIFTDS